LIAFLPRIDSHLVGDCVSDRSKWWVIERDHYLPAEPMHSII